MQIVCVFDADQVAKEAFFVRTLQVCCTLKKTFRLPPAQTSLFREVRTANLSCSR